MREVYVLKLKKAKESRRCLSCEHCHGLCFRDAALFVCDIKNSEVHSSDSCVADYLKKTPKKPTGPVEMRKFSMKECVEVVNTLNKNNAGIDFNSYFSVHSFVSSVLPKAMGEDIARTISFRLMIANKFFC